MPSSRRACSPDAARRPDGGRGLPRSARPDRAARLRRGFASDRSAVSEVTGHILMLGVTSGLILLAILTFNDSAEQAVERGVEQQADALAHGLAAAIVSASLAADSGDNITLSRTFDAPRDLSGRAYDFDLDPARLAILVPSHDFSRSVPLFGIAQSLTVCDMAPLHGGPVHIQYSLSPPAGCPAGPTLFLEEAP